MNVDKKDLLLYAVTDRHWLNGRTLYSVVKESLDGGVTFLQLREKELDEAHSWKRQRNCRSYVKNTRFLLLLMIMWILHLL